MNKWTKLGVTLFATSALLVACGDSSSSQPATQTESATEQSSQTDDQVKDASQDESKDDSQEESSADKTDDKDDKDDQDDQDDQNDSADDADDSSQTSSTTVGLEEQEFETDVEKAISLFEDSYTASIDSISLSYDDGVAKYDVDGFDDQKEYEVVINAETGEIISQSDEVENDDDSDEQAIDFSKVVSAKEAMTAALGSIEGGSVEEWTLHYEDGLLVYEIELLDDNGQAIDEIIVDAETAEIIAQD